MADYLGKDMFKLGFGLMRLPKNEDGSIDVPQTSDMVDAFIAAGGTYFDTAFVYTGSEDAIKQALVDRYPRESYTLATKLNAWLGEPDREAAKQQLYTSLERTGAGYFDFYLLHAIMRTNYETYEKYGLWDFVKEQKEKEINSIITEENLKADETKKFVDNAFRDGELKSTGVGIDSLLPPMRRFGGNSNRAEKKQTVIEKLKAFFEKYFGIGSSFKTDVAVDKSE